MFRMFAYFSPENTHAPAQASPAIYISKTEGSKLSTETIMESLKSFQCRIKIIYLKSSQLQISVELPKQF